MNYNPYWSGNPSRGQNRRWHSNDSYRNYSGTPPPARPRYYEPVPPRRPRRNFHKPFQGNSHAWPQNKPFLSPPRLYTRAASPLPGSEEYMQRDISEKSALLKWELELEGAEAVDLNRLKIRTNAASKDEEERIQEKDTVRKPKRAKHLQALTSLTAEEIHDKIINHISNLSYSKKYNFVNQSGPSGYDYAVQQITRQKRTELSRALRDMCNNKFKKSEESSAVINAIIPDFDIQIESLPHEFLEQLSSTFNEDFGGCIVDPEVLFRQAEDMLTDCGSFEFDEREEQCAVDQDVSQPETNVSSSPQQEESQTSTPSSEFAVLQYSKPQPPPLPYFSPELEIPFPDLQLPPLAIDESLINEKVPENNPPILSLEKLEEPINPEEVCVKPKIFVIKDMLVKAVQETNIEPEVKNVREKSKKTLDVVESKNVKEKSKSKAEESDKSAQIKKDAGHNKQSKSLSHEGDKIKSTNKKLHYSDSKNGSRGARSVSKSSKSGEKEDSHQTNPSRSRHKHKYHRVSEEKYRERVYSSDTDERMSVEYDDWEENRRKRSEEKADDKQDKKRKHSHRSQKSVEKYERYYHTLRTKYQDQTTHDHSHHHKTKHHKKSTKKHKKRREISTSSESASSNSDNASLVICNSPEIEERVVVKHTKPLKERIQIMSEVKSFDKKEETLDLTDSEEVIVVKDEPISPKIKESDKPSKPSSKEAQQKKNVTYDCVIKAVPEPIILTDETFSSDIPSPFLDKNLDESLDNKEGDKLLEEPFKAIQRPWKSPGEKKFMMEQLVPQADEIELEISEDQAKPEILHSAEVSSTSESNKVEAAKAEVKASVVEVLPVKEVVTERPMLVTTYTQTLEDFTPKPQEEKSQNSRKRKRKLYNFGVQVTPSVHNNFTQTTAVKFKNAQVQVDKSETAIETQTDEQNLTQNETRKILKGKRNNNRQTTIKRMFDLDREIQKLVELRQSLYKELEFDEETPPLENGTQTKRTSKNKIGKNNGIEPDTPEAPPDKKRKRDSNGETKELQNIPPTKASLKSHDVPAKTAKKRTPKNTQGDKASSAEISPGKIVENVPQIEIKTPPPEEIGPKLGKENETQRKRRRKTSQKSETVQTPRKRIKKVEDIEEVVVDTARKSLKKEIATGGVEATNKCFKQDAVKLEEITADAVQTCNDSDSSVKQVSDTPVLVENSPEKSDLPVEVNQENVDRIEDENDKQIVDEKHDKTDEKIDRGLDENLDLEEGVKGDTVDNCLENAQDAPKIIETTPKPAKRRRRSTSTRKRRRAGPKNYKLKIKPLNQIGVVKLARFTIDQLNIMRNNIRDLPSLALEDAGEIKSEEEKEEKMVDETESVLQSEETVDEQAEMDFTGFSGAILVIKVINETIVAATDHGQLIYFNLNSSEITHTFDISKVSITSLLIIKGNLYVGSLNTNLTVINFESKQICKEEKFDEPIQCMENAWEYIFIGSDRGSLIRFDLNSEKVQDVIKIAESNVLAIKATNEGPRKVLVIATRLSPVCIRDACSGLLLRLLETPFTPTVYTILFNKNLVYCATSQHDILVYTFEDGQLVLKHDATKCKGVVCMQIIGNLLFAGCYNGNVYIYNTKTNSHLGTITGPGGLLLSLEIFSNKILIGTKSNKFKALQIPQRYLDEI